MKSKFKILLFLTTVISLIGVIVSKNTEEKIQGEVQSQILWSEWQTNSLKDAQEQVLMFLDEQKGVNGINRPYQNNVNWTEGSLEALDLAYQSSLNASTGISEEYSRILLEKTANKLEVKPIFGLEVDILAQNNYPDAEGNYIFEYKNPVPLAGVEESTPPVYDIAFVLDWSGSMNYGFEGIPNPRFHGKEMIETLSKHVMGNYPDSRIRLLGYNAPYNNLGIYYRERDSSWVSSNQDWESIINDVFKQTSFVNVQDDLTMFLKDTIDMFLGIDVGTPNTGLREDAIPVIILISDFHIVQNSNDQKFTDQIDRFWNLYGAKDNKSIFLPIKYTVKGGADMNIPAGWLEERTQNIPERAKDGWSSLIVDTTQSGEVALKEITRIFDSSIPSLVATNRIELPSPFFDYTAGSFLSGSPNASVITEIDKKMIIENKIIGKEEIKYTDKGSYKTYFNLSTTDEMIGKQESAFKEGKLRFAEKGFQHMDQVINHPPNLFVPTTEGAIELYRYNGVGDVSDVNNYTLKEEIVGTNYKLLGGKKTYLENSDLSSLVYGKMLTKTEAIEIVKKTKVPEFESYNFFSEGLPTAESQRFDFDVYSNIYKLYAVPRETTLKINYVNDQGQKINESTVSTHLVGESYNVQPQDLTQKGWVYSKESGDPAEGILGQHGAEVTFIYRLGKVVLQSEYLFKDEQDNYEELLPSISVTYGFNETYTTSSNEPAATQLGYVLVSSDTAAPPSGQTGVTEKTLVVKYLFEKGKITIEAPSLISFGEQKLISFGNYTMTPTENIKLSIVDQLQGKWDLMLGISEKITHDIDQTDLEGVFSFVRNDGSIAEISETAEVIYAKEKNEVIPKLDLEWETQKQEGLLFTQFSGNKQGRYSGKFTWILQNGL